MDCYESKYDCEIEKKLNTTMPWVGLYIAAASAVCTLAIVADAFNGLRLKKLWFPCKYFSVNATSLTLLAVAMKLPMDLNTIMIKSSADWFAKHISLNFMSMALGHFMSSLGSKNDKEILANVVALGILVITIAANMWIQIILLWHDFGSYLILNIVPLALMLFSLAIFISLAITVPSCKRSLEAKYQEKHKEASREDEVLKTRDEFTIVNQRGEMMKYWVMAETSSPQFVMARSVVSTTSALICLFAATTEAVIYILSVVYYHHASVGRPESLYGVYTLWILSIQSIGVVVGTIAPTLRWFLAVSFKCSTTNRNSFKRIFKIEAYWIQTLVDWRDSSSALHIQQDKCRKYLHDAKRFAITLCIGLQIFIVALSKLLVLLSALLISQFLVCFTRIKKFIMQHSLKNMIPSNQVGHGSGDDTDLELSHYVLLLEGEAELPSSFLKYICREADNTIQIGRKRQPKNLATLLHKFVKFNGVGQFDTDKIPSLHSQEPPNCWTLPVVTLTSIAIALPNIAKHRGKQLLSSVTEGLSLAKLVEKTLDESTNLVNIRKAADVCWVSVVIRMNWLDRDLKKISLDSKNSKAVLQELSNKAEGIIMEFKREVRDSLMENPFNWPAKVVIANSMYRIARTILLSCDEQESEHTDERLFEQLSIMIADILAACLTNLPRVITTMCHHNSIEKREKCVRKAFLLLGKTEHAIEVIQQQEWSSLDHDKTASIEEWRALFQQDKDGRAASASCSSDKTMTSTPLSSEEHLAIMVDR